MESVVFLTVWGLAMKLLLPPLGAILLGAMLASFLRIWTQLDDQAISFVGRIAALALFFSVTSQDYFRPVIEFAEQTWGKSAYYH